jgi:hypothetical protein
MPQSATLSKTFDEMMDIVWKIRRGAADSTDKELYDDADRLNFLLGGASLLLHLSTAHATQEST